MKITDLKALVVNAVMRNWVFVKVETDQPGLFGWGEATLEWKTRAVVGCVEDFKPMVVGQDPTRIEFLWQIMYRHSFFRPGAIAATAMSGIEQACWDILGKTLGVPVYELLGGRVRDKIRMYTHLGGGEMKAVYETSEVEPLLERAESVIERGYRAVKVVVVPFSQPLMGLPAVKHFAKLVGALRKEVGDDIDLMIDFHGRTTTGQAIQYINAIEEFHPLFCEEPVPPEQPDALLEVRRAVRRAHRQRRALGDALAVSSPLRIAGLPHPPTGHRPLRRPAGGAQDRRSGGDLSDGGGPAQSQRTCRQRGGLAL
jgi:galactonate dehydratase